MKNAIAIITLSFFAVTSSFAQSNSSSSSKSKTNTSRGTCTTTYKSTSYSPSRTKTTTTTKKGCDNQRKTYNMAFDSKTTYKPKSNATRQSKGNVSGE